jgi:hypothetical protein
VPDGGASEPATAAHPKQDAGRRGRDAGVSSRDAGLHSQTHSGHGADAEASSPSAEFNPPPVADGYQRFETTPVEVLARSSEDWAQWVGGPLDQDYDVLDITGQQSEGGHHALLYASPDGNPAGFTRLWKDEDQLSTRLMGGIGGEGGASAQLPPGVVFRVQKGSYLVAQTHFLNGEKHSLIGRTVLDVKLAPVDRSRRVASIFSSTTLGVKLAPSSETTIDVDCTIREDLHFLQFANHMHDYGQTVLTEFTDSAGEVHELKSDTSWFGMWALNPNFEHFEVAAPATVPAGSRLHTRCTYDNKTSDEVAFPAEMCVFFGFILSDSDIYCTDDKWTVASNAVADDTATGSAVDGQAGDAGVGSSVADAAKSPGGCLASADQAIMESSDFDRKSTDCSLPCAFNTDVASCTSRCFEKDVGLSASCARCNGINVACGAKKCLSACVSDSASAGCRACVLENCDPAFHVCTGT